MEFANATSAYLKRFRLELCRSAEDPGAGPAPPPPPPSAGHNPRPFHAAGRPNRLRSHELQPAAEPGMQLPPPRHRWARGREAGAGVGG